MSAEKCIGWPRPSNKKRTITIAGHKTCVSLEDAFWNALREIAANKNVSRSDLVSKIDKCGNLSSAIRLFVLDHYRHLAELKRLGD
jgi:predicted DNA-binding ribbon-helix-helix protein